jgi:hypothetical protein
MTEFEINKREYFFRLGLETRAALRLHRNEGGLWDRRDDDPKRERDWGNVSEHTMVVAARCEVLADFLELSPQVKQGLLLAAQAHDFYKKHFVELTKNSPDPRSSTLISEQESAEIVQKSGLPVETIEIFGFLSDTNILEEAKIAGQSVLSELDLAKLVLCYTDQISLNSEWIESMDSEGNNNLDRRVLRNDSNPKYVQNSEEWRRDLGGESLHEALRRVGHLAENRLTEILNTKLDNPIEPSRLPEFIDENIKQRILEI